RSGATSSARPSNDRRVVRGAWYVYERPRTTHHAPHTTLMDRQSRIDYLLDLYQNPTHKAPMEDADVTLEGGNPGCGDIVTYHIKVGPDGRLTAISFEGEGCTISQAAAELVADESAGRTLDE